jgi:hypothetical protein
LYRYGRSATSELPELPRGLEGPSRLRQGHANQLERCDDVTQPGLGTARRAKSFLLSTPKRSVTGQGRPKLIRAEWMRFLSIERCLTR